MGLKFPPTPGLIVICDYDTGFKPAEMIKGRLGVVVSPRLPHKDKLCTIVPPSITASKSGIHYQCRIELPIDPPAPYQGRIKWAKADMMATVSYQRLSLPYTSRDPNTGKRKYLQIRVVADDMVKVRKAMLFALGLDNLTEHL